MKLSGQAAVAACLVISGALYVGTSIFAQSVTLSPVPRMQFLDNSGRPLAGGKVYTYVAGTSTPQATYQDSGGGVPNANPIILDAGGRASIWLSAASYKFILQDTNGVTIWTADGVTAPNLATFLPLAGGTMTGAILFSANQNVGSAGNPAGIVYTNGGLQVGGTSAIDNGRNANIQNLTIAGTVSGALDSNTGFKISGTTAIDNARNAFLNHVEVDSGTLQILRSGIPKITLSNGGLGVGGVISVLDSTGVSTIDLLDQSGITTSGVITANGSPTSLALAGKIQMSNASALYFSGSAHNPVISSTGDAIFNSMTVWNGGGVWGINSGGGAFISSLQVGTSPGLTTTVTVPCGVLTFTSGVLTNKGTC